MTAQPVLAMDPWTVQGHDVFWFGLVGTVGLSWIFTRLMIRWAPRLGLMDFPGDRKVHSQPIPKGGGLAIFFALATVIAICTARPYFLPPEIRGWALPSLFDVPFLVAAIIVLVGLWDDLRPLPWLFRLGVHTGAAVVAVGDCLHPGMAWQLALCTLWLVAMINAFNMLDNMDALSAGIAWIAAGCLAVMLFDPHGRRFMDHFILGFPLLLLMGSIAGFLWFNRAPARIFLGDAGSTFLGYSIGFGSFAVVVNCCTPWSILAILAICAVPIYDQTTTVLLRLSQGRSPFHADKQHLSHRLVARGLSKPAAVGVIHLLALVSGGVGLIVYWQESGWTAGLLFAALAGGWVGLAIFEFAFPTSRDRQGGGESQTAP